MISAAGHSAPCVRCNKWIHREPKSHSSIPPGHCRLLAVIPSLFLRLDTMPAQRDAAPRVGIPTPRWAVQQCILHLKWQNTNAFVRRCCSTRRQFESPPGRPVQRCPQSSSQRVATPTRTSTSTEDARLLHAALHDAALPKTTTPRERLAAIVDALRRRKAKQRESLK